MRRRLALCRFQWRNALTKNARFAGVFFTGPEIKDDFRSEADPAFTAEAIAGPPVEVHPHPYESTGRRQGSAAKTEFFSPDGERTACVLKSRGTKKACLW